MQAEENDNIQEQKSVAIKGTEYSSEKLNDLKGKKNKSRIS